MESNPNSQSPKSTHTWLWLIAILAVLIGLLWAIALPNFVHSGPSRLSGIFNRLRQIDGAKEQWAINHGLTNAAQLTREITEKDLATYLLPYFTEKEFGSPQYGEHYLIKRLNESPEALLTSKFKEAYGSSFSLPKGTILRLNASGGAREQIILPGQATNQIGKIDSPKN